MELEIGVLQPWAGAVRVSAGCPGLEHRCPAGDRPGARPAGWAACPVNATQWEDGRFDAAVTAAVTPKLL